MNNPTATPAAATGTSSPSSGFGALFTQIINKGVDVASSYANASLAVKSAEAQNKANIAAYRETAAMNAAAPGASKVNYMPWIIGGGIALLGLLGLGFLLRR